MPCYHPLLFEKYTDVSTGEIKCKPFRGAHVHEGLIADYDRFPVPCGKCLGCRLDYAKTWSVRCLLEARCWSENWFLTITYDDDHIPTDESLHPEHMQEFLKRLREYYRERGHVGVRFYLCGEYGDRTFRPHYHMIAFNLPLPDLELYSTSKLGDLYYNSKTLSDIWQRGFVVVGEVTPESCAYTARYVQKKAKKFIDYEKLGIAPEFVRMSRNPGIGAYYFEENARKLIEEDKVYLPNGRIASLPRYFETLAMAREMDVQALRDHRREVARIGSVEPDVFECPQKFVDRLADLEGLFLKKTKCLQRNL